MTDNPPRRSSRAHNLGTVIAFEIRRTLKRRSFWAMTLAVPVLMIGLTALIFFSSSTAERNSAAQADEIVAFTYTDASGLVDPTIAKAAGGVPSTDGPADRKSVIDGQRDLFIAYPADPSKEPIDVVGRDRGITSGIDYGGIARQVLVASAEKQVSDARVASILTQKPLVRQVTYLDGHVAPGVASVVLPGLFLVFFYMAILLLGNQMLNITVEEKENRVTEMILTTIHPTTLIVGKLIALVVVGIVQSLVVAIPMIGVPALALTRLAPEASEVSGVVPSLGELVAAINGPAIALGAALFLGSFLMFTGILLSIGAIMPTAKDAGSAFGVVVIGLFLPFYAMGVVVTDPHGIPSSVLTYFPLTSPVTAMIRNATGTLYAWEAALALVVVYGCAVAFLSLGISLFRTGSISYDAKLDLRKMLRRGRPNPV